MIRLANKQDAAQILDIYGPYVENTPITFETIVPSVEEIEARLENVLENYPWLICEENNIILGYAYAHKYHERFAYRWAVDVSIYVRQDWRTIGIGKKLYAALLSILKLQGYHNAYAAICLPNEASVGIYEYFGFNKIGHFKNVGYKLERWHDDGWWELFLQPHNSMPSEPLSLRNIEQNEFSKALIQDQEQEHTVNLGSHKQWDFVLNQRSPPRWLSWRNSDFTRQIRRQQYKVLDTEQVGVYTVDGNNRENIKPGTHVLVIQKQDQRTGKRTEGIVKDILTNSSTHPHGIKVRLINGIVGRVQQILP